MKIFTVFTVCLFTAAAFGAASRNFPDARSTSPAVIETSWGPDAFGYIARDSNEPGGPAYQWIDISGAGTAVTGLGDDNIVGPFNIGFPFRYYWYDVISFYVGSNGYIRFSGGGQLSDPFNTIPNPAAPNDIVCPYTTDWNPGQNGTVYYWSNNVDSLIVSYNNIAAWLPGGSTGDHSFQIILSMVDTSITFNIGPQTGSLNNTNGMVGIENNAGTIGIQNYATNVVPANYSIKFYYPPVILLDIHDIAVTRVQNGNSGGFFLQTGDDFQANATIRNTGNQNENNFYVIGEVRRYPANTLVHADSFLVSGLNAGEILNIDFSENWTMDTPGNYYLRVKSALTGDMVISNDQVDVELHVVDLPGELAFDDGVSEQTWSWNGGTGGMGIYYVPPAYPAKITQLRAYLGAGTTPTFLELYNDDGLNGEPGSVIASFSVTATTAGWQTINLTDSNFVIQDGGVYPVWRMNGTTSSGLGLDQSSISSRQTWEYTGVWAVFRSFETDDAMLRISVEQIGQVVFSDDFEGGLANWSGTWALTTTASNSPTHSYTDSPGGNYPPNSTVIGQLAGGINLSSFLGATLEFYTRYELETGFDYCYLEASTDGGTNWLHMKTYNGEGVVTQFTLESLDIGAFAGQSDVRFRFRLVTDGGYETDGMYVDDVTVTGSFIDESPPLLQYQAPQHYEGVPDTFHFPVTITDLSGVASATLSYWVDNVLPVIHIINASSIVNDVYQFDIPPIESGSLVRFYVEASDGTTPANSVSSDTLAYITGSHQIYDDGEPEYIVTLAAGSRCAVRFDAPPVAFPKLTTALLRIYTDTSNPVDSITVHVWADNGGVPGADLITPFKVYPAATLAQPQAWTRVDFRSLELQPGGAYWVGYENTSGIPIIHLYDSPAVYNRTSTYTTGSWTTFAGDFHIRAVLGYPTVGIAPDLPTDIPKTYALFQNYPNPFNPTTVISWQLAGSSDVRLSLYDLTGREVAVLVNEQQPAGHHSIEFNASDLASGVYLYRLQTGNFTATRKMLLIR